MWTGNFFKGVVSVVVVLGIFGIGYSIGQHQTGHTNRAEIIKYNGFTTIKKEVYYCRKGVYINVQ